MEFKSDLAPIADTVLYDLAPELKKWVGWFRPATDDTSGRFYHAHSCSLYHARTCSEVWEAHSSRHLTWMGKHPWAPHWVTEVLHHVRAEPIDIYEGVFVIELLRLLDVAETAEEPSRALTDFVTSGTDLFDDAESLKKWMCSSDHRENYLQQVISDSTRSHTMQGLPEALSLSMACERGDIAKRLIEALRSDKGVFPAWLQSDFNGIADYTGLAENMLRKASRLLWDLDHSGFVELVRTYKEARLFRLPTEVREAQVVEDDNREVPANLERTLARAALTVDLLG